MCADFSPLSLPLSKNHTHIYINIVSNVHGICCFADSDEQPPTRRIQSQKAAKSLRKLDGNASDKWKRDFC